MKIVTTKISSHKYSTVVTRDDGVVLSIPGVGPSKPIPHDLIHFVTEDELSIDYGFWGCVASGVIYNGMSIIEGKVNHNSRMRSQSFLKSNGRMGGEAEFLASIIFTIYREGIVGDRLKIKSVLDYVWHSDNPKRHELTFDEIERICERISVLANRWQKLNVNQAVVLNWGNKRL